MKERLKKELRVLTILLIAGFCYLIFVLITDIRIPCIFKVITSFDCPGCGITRMCVAIAGFDFAAAFHYNPVIFVTLPLILGCLVYERVTYIRTGHNKFHPLHDILLGTEIAVLIIYGVIRNIG